MNPEKFKSELIAEQNKHAGKCIYHLSKSHPTSDCYIKKECEKLLAAKKTTASHSSVKSGSNQGQLRHITENRLKKSVMRKLLIVCLTCQVMILMRSIYISLRMFPIII
jgi:hypothetical protein